MAQARSSLFGLLSPANSPADMHKTGWLETVWHPAFASRPPDVEFAPARQELLALGSHPGQSLLILRAHGRHLRP